MTQYVEPQANASAYTCPHCGTLAQVRRDVWEQVLMGGGRGVHVPGWSRTKCTVCAGDVVWFKKERRWPLNLIGPTPHEGMPDAIRQTYVEAQEVGGRSPRAAGALLRLALEQLVELLVDAGDLNTGIGELVRQGLPRTIQQAMDVLRVTGNHAVHPGEALRTAEEPETVQALFQLLNLVVEDRIARPAQIEALFDALPEGSRRQIERRDQQGR